MPSTALQQLAQYDEATLERLLALADLIFVPEEDLMVTATMEQMVAKAHLLADTHFPEWTDRSASDFGEFLVELFALFSEKDFYYINAFANEGFLQKATAYESVYSLARMLGYTPRHYTSAKHKFSVTFSAGPAVTIAKGGIRIAAGGVSFLNEFPVQLAVAGSSVTRVLDFISGVRNQETTVFNGRAVRIASQGIDPASVEQVIAGVSWTQVQSFSRSTPSSRHFIVNPSEDGSIEVVYGRGGYGTRPALGASVVTTYVSGTGIAGNIAVPTSPVTISESPATRTITTSTHISRPVDGTTAETLEEIRSHASMDFRTQQRIVNTSDLETVLAAYEDIHKVKGTLWSNNFYFYAIPASGTAADATMLAEYRSRILGQQIQGFNLWGLPTTYQAITTDLTAYVLAGTDLVAAEQAIRDQLEYYTDPLGGAEYGQGFMLADVLASLVQNVLGLQNVVFNLVNGVAAANVPLGSNAILSKLDPITDVTIAIIQV